jgi:hypothetical protein
MENNLPHAAIIDGRCYGYGNTLDDARAETRRRLAGATHEMALRMWRRIEWIALTDEQASDVAAMIASEAISWER